LATGVNTVAVVVEGYARRLPGGGWQATSTSVLVTTPGGVRILVDPGCNRPLLLDGLAREGIAPGDVDYVFLTHHHLDHTLNAALFASARVIDYEAVYDGDRATPAGSAIPGTEVEIVPTPGHSPDHASLLVPTARGLVAIAGDVFWWYDGTVPVLDPDAPDDYATDAAALRRSRRVLLRRAAWLVPGHGGPTGGALLSLASRAPDHRAMLPSGQRG
jgi:glyoxylase-like metal-dependent hydrolase (beta-lactamase superfamily II)